MEFDEQFLILLQYRFIVIFLPITPTFILNIEYNNTICHVFQSLKPNLFFLMETYKAGFQDLENPFLLFALCLSVCVCVCMHAFMCVCKGQKGEIYVWKSENVKYQSLLSTKTGSSYFSVYIRLASEDSSVSTFYLALESSITNGTIISCFTCIQEIQV